MRAFLLLLCVLLTSCALLPEEKNITAYAEGRPLPTPQSTPEPEKEETEEVPAFQYAEEAVHSWVLEAGEGTTLTSEKATKIVQIEQKQGTLTLKKGKIYLKAGEKYSLSFVLFSSLPVSIGVTVSANGKEVFQAYDIDAGEEKEVSFSFTPQETSWEGELTFYLNDSCETAHEIVIRDLLLQPAASPTIGIRCDQVGYNRERFKTATLAYDGGDVFYLCRAEDGRIVYRGEVVNGRQDDRNGEYNYLCDFSDWQEEGEYYLLSETGISSYPFTISEDPYQELLTSVIRFFTLQRCGIDLSDEIAGDYAREACHTSAAAVYGWGDKSVDVRGGWHDAGDYGRYLQTGNKALAALLMSQYIFRSENDALNIPESGNGVPDLLDECRYELDWLLKMTKDDGTPYNKATTQNFAGLLLPQEDKETIYVLPSWTLTTASYAGVTALASLLYKDIDPEYAEVLAHAAIRAGQVLQADPQEMVHNPADFQTGEYSDTDESDERFFAAAALWALTHEDTYRDKAKELWQKGVENHLSAGLKDYGVYILLNELPRQDELAQLLYEQLISDADRSADRLRSRNYGYAPDDFHWGSNQHAAEDGFLLLSAWKFSGDPSYKELAAYELDYLLGQNGNGLCFVTGFGEESPSDIHHRIAMKSGKTLPGALVGGPDQYLSEDSMRAFSESTPVAKRYIDNESSYSSNEVALAYNSVFVLFLSFFSSLD